MSEPKLISPILDNFAMGDPMSSHHGVRCCPAMMRDSDNKYIVKIISIPASQVQLNALLLTGAYKSEGAALSYFKELADGVVQEAQTLQKLSALEGFVPYESWQIVPMENEVGYDVYLLGSYRRTLERFFRRNTMTHLGAVNLGLDLCAAAAVARRSGYLYVDLKPGNICISENQEYRICDLGFIPMASLKYASLPDKYRSRYTAPEIRDAFSSLNDTLDIYAIGMILYQAYNGGTLPFADAAPEEPLPPPPYADYEIAEIILKACAPDPKDRWKDPIEMGQALVSYMQRNSVNDTPIVTRQEPPAAQPDMQSDTQSDTQPQPDGGEEAQPMPDTAVTSASEDDLVEQIIQETNQAIDSEDAAADDTFPLGDEEDAADLSFMDHLVSDETAPDEEHAGEIDYEELSEDISDILSQADDLIAHETPDPVVAPDPIDVPMPPPIVPEPEAPEPLPPEDETRSALAEEPAPEETRIDTDNGDEDADEDDNEDEDDAFEDEKPKRKHSAKGFLTAVIVILLIGVLAVGGYFFYQEYYIQTIDDLQLTGTEDQLTVLLTSDIDDALLSVVCVDTFGNKTVREVTGGSAVFEDLTPNTIYNVHVEIDGLHKLEGRTTASYTTPAQTNIVQFNAIAGSTDGSVVLTITVDGQKADTWNITYSAADEAEQTVSFTGNMVTINGLTTGKEYTFRLSTDEQLYITGQNELIYKPIPLVYAENLEIVSCAGDTLTARWTVPEGAAVESWTVRCYNESGYDQSVTVNTTEASFTGIDPSSAYTVEVVAAGMSIGRQVYMTVNSLTIANIQTEITDLGQISISWSHEGIAPSDGWLLMYAIGDSTHQEVIHCADDTALVSPAVPGARYSFSIQSSDGATIFGGEFTVDMPEAEKFYRNDLGMSADDVTPHMCRTPEAADWSKNNLSLDDYTTTFAVGEKASFYMSCSQYDYSNSYIDLLVSCVIRDAQGNVVSATAETRTWYRDLWYNGASYMDIPALPDTPGDYTASVYYNGMLVFTQAFTMTE